MGSHVALRLLHALLVLLGVWTVVFFLIRLSGDPALLFVSLDATPAEIQRVRERLGLDQPLVVQYVRFLGSALRGDLGDSLRYGRPALVVVAERLPATLELTAAALLITTAVGVASGVLAATHPGSWVDAGVSAFTLIGQAVPFFWLGLLLILVFGVTLRWLPISGQDGPQHLVMPAVTVAWYFTARVSRLTRANMLEVLYEDYIRTARSKGLADRAVLYGHAMRNASLSIITVIGLTFQALVGGAVVTETIFGWPGVGSVLVQAVFNRDYALVQADVLVATLFVTIANLVVDLTYFVLDPRIRLI
jgi:peptide/nickel transport system permease protein